MFIDQGNTVKSLYWALNFNEVVGRPKPDIKLQEQRLTRISTNLHFYKMSSKGQPQHYMFIAIKDSTVNLLSVTNKLAQFMVTVQKHWSAVTLYECVGLCQLLTRFLQITH